MPVVLTACPQCERPIDLDLVRDGPVAACPCCDRKIEVPAARLRNAPAVVWIAAALVLLLPAGLVPGLLELLPRNWYALAVLVPAVGLLPVAAALLLARRWAWIVALVLAITALFGALGLAFFSFPLAFIVGLALYSMLLTAAVVAALGGALTFSLLLRSCRYWCDR